MPREELERLMFFETAREQAEKDWSHNPRDTQASGFPTHRRPSPSRLAACDAARHHGATSPGVNRVVCATCAAQEALKP
jgi:hypothetical protein